MRKVRLISVSVHPQLVLDDGNNLTPLQVQPITILVADWPNILSMFDEALQQLRAQVEQPDDAPA